MDTIFRIKSSDLNLDFLNAIKSLFKNDEEIQLQISSQSDFSVIKHETQAEANLRIEKSFNNLKKKRNIVSLTGDEFLLLSQKFMNK